MSKGFDIVFSKKFLEGSKFLVFYFVVRRGAYLVGERSQVAKA